ncbi:alpha/beta fold hydrolase [[Kitasatospora] papulosa]
MTATPPVALAAGAGSTPVPHLDWQPCALPPGTTGPAGQECAILPVPLDHLRSGGRTVPVAVTRLRSDRPENRRGTLVVIPGGPGSSGVQRPAQKGAVLQEELKGAYDLVSLDPRGVGGSVKARCGIPAADRRLVTLRSWPTPGGGTTESAERSRRTAGSCAANGGAVLRSFTTRNEARDIDLFRQALGEREVSVWGTSYGGYVEAVYDRTHPGSVDRVVLDSTGDPDPSRVARGGGSRTCRAVRPTASRTSRPGRRTPRARRRDCGWPRGPKTSSRCSSRWPGNWTALHATRGRPACR